MASYNSLNKVMLLGRLGKDPDVRESNSGIAIAKFSLATTENTKKEDGSFQGETQWHNVVVFGAQAENCKRFIEKGSLVLIEGRIQSRKYTDKSDNERSITEIIANMVRFIGKKEDTKTESQTTPTATTWSVP